MAHRSRESRPRAGVAMSRSGISTRTCLGNHAPGQAIQSGSEALSAISRMGRYGPENHAPEWAVRRVSQEPCPPSRCCHSSSRSRCLGNHAPPEQAVSLVESQKSRPRAGRISVIRVWVLAPGTMPPSERCGLPGAAKSRELRPRAGRRIQRFQGSCLRASRRSRGLRPQTR